MEKISQVCRLIAVAAAFISSPANSPVLNWLALQKKGRPPQWQILGPKAQETENTQSGL
jgi:hypothetical protein